MNSARQYFLSLWAVGMLAGAATAQAPDAWLTPPRNNAATADATPADASPLTSTSPIGGAVPADGCGWFGGVGFYLIQPFFQNNPAYTIFVQRTNDTTL